MLQLRNISKAYPGVQALDRVDFDLKPGEVHVLFGENGAGKSTLINVLSGIVQPTEGEYLLNGQLITRLTPDQAGSKGIGAVFQEFSLVPSLTVTENLFLGRPITRWGLLRKRDMAMEARRVLDSLGFAIPEDALVGHLSRAQRQMVEIAKALAKKPTVLILDEPTASLTDVEANRLIEIVKDLRSQGVGIIYVSHRMPEIRALADRVTVLRSGQRVGTLKASDVSETALIEMMTGRRFDAAFPSIQHNPGPVRLAVRNLSTIDKLVEDVSLELRPGEIVGIAGLVGCGKSEIGRAVFGLEPISAGSVLLDGVEITRLDAKSMLQRGVCYFTSDRVAEGLAVSRPVSENGSMAALDLTEISRFGFLKKQTERAHVLAAVKRLGLRPLSLDRAVATLSGGNKQKVLLARGLVRQTKVFIFDEPTVGVDVGAKYDIYSYMGELARDGACILLISSDLPEVLNMSNRIYVMSNGRIVRQVIGDNRTEKAVLEGFFGHPLSDVHTETAQESYA